jgi:glycosyltransferase involved in cell wall biosynthesis
MQETVYEVRISVILPTLPRSETLNLAVRSTLSAMSRRDELLVLVEGTLEADKSLEKIKDPRLRVFYRQEVEGIASGLNLLLNHSRGRYIARMDSDDICLPWRFALQTRHIEKKNADFVFLNSILFGKGVRPLFIIPQIPMNLHGRLVGLELLRQNPFVHPTMLARKTALRQMEGYRHSVAEDYDLWVRAWVKGFHLYRSAGYGVLYRVHADQYSQQKNFVKQVLSDKLLRQSKGHLIEKLISDGFQDSQLIDNFELAKVLGRLSARYRFLNLSFVRRFIDFLRPGI